MIRSLIKGSGSALPKRVVSNAELAKTFSDIYENKSKPLPLVPAEDQFESTVGKAMNQMFATVASGGTVSKADIKAALTTAQQAVEAAG